MTDTRDKKYPETDAVSVPPLSVVKKKLQIPSNERRDRDSEL